MVKVIIYFFPFYYSTFHVLPHSPPLLIWYAPFFILQLYLLLIMINTLISIIPFFIRSAIEPSC